MPLRRGISEAPILQYRARVKLRRATEIRNGTCLLLLARRFATRPGCFLRDPIDVIVKAFVQPIQSTRATRLSTEYLQEVFGTIEADDHLGIFPVVWAGQRLEFQNWSQSGDDFIEYERQRYFVINANMIPDPGDGNPEHHWELGMRVIRSDGLSG